MGYAAPRKVYAPACVPVEDVPLGGNLSSRFSSTRGLFLLFSPFEPHDVPLRQPSSLLNPATRRSVDSNS